MTTLIILLTLVLWYGTAGAIQCAYLPIIGDGQDQKFDTFGDPTKTTGDWRPDIPDEIIGNKQKGIKAQPYSAVHPIPPSPDGSPAHADTVTCFDDNVVMPQSLATARISVVEAKNIIEQRDPGVDSKQIDKLVSPPTKIGRAIQDTVRSWAWAARLFETAIAWAASAIDDFNRADNSDIGANWDQNTTFDLCAIVNNEVRQTTGGLPCDETYNALVPGGAQYSKVTIGTYTGGTGDYVSAVVRSHQTNDQMYICNAEVSGGATTTRLRRRNTGGSTLASENATTWAGGDTVELRANGTNLDCLRNGSGLLATTDATFATGRAGIQIGAASASTTAVTEIDLGDLAVATTRRNRAMVLQ